MVKLDDTWLLLHSTLWNSFPSDDEQAEKGIAAAVHRRQWVCAVGRAAASGVGVHMRATQRHR